MEVSVQFGEFTPRNIKKHISTNLQAILDKGEVKQGLLKHFDEEYLNKKVSSLGYTYLELQAAFGLIAPKDHWKDPIDAIILAEDYDVCAEACSFITGSSLVELEQIDETKIRVEAEGYFNAIGA